MTQAKVGWDEGCRLESRRVEYRPDVTASSVLVVPLLLQLLMLLVMWRRKS